MTADRKLTGWHVLFIFVGAFGVIITVNLTLAFNAVRTFPGLEVDNSYVASQTFDARRDAQLALGWTVGAEYAGDRLVLSITDRAGQPVQIERMEATLGRATHVKDDRTPAFVFDGTAYVAAERLAPGNWNLRMKAIAPDGTMFQQRIPIYVRG